MITNATLSRPLTFSKEQYFSEPYPHVVIDDFFSQQAADLITSHFNELKSRGISESWNIQQIARFPSYDAYCYVFPREIDSPMSFFHSLPFITYLAKRFNLPLTTDVVAEYHHHKPNSKSGVSHNDYVDCYVVENFRPDGTNPWHFECNYMGGNSPEINAVKRVRAIAFIYYFSDDCWKPGDGGETAVFGPDQKSLVKKIDPLNNRLFAFKISPESWHAFVGNKQFERNSIIGWMHLKPEDAEALYSVKSDSWGNEVSSGERGDILNVS